MGVHNTTHLPSHTSHDTTYTYLKEGDDVGGDGQLRQDAVGPRVAGPKGGGGDGEDIAGLGLFLVCMDRLSFDFPTGQEVDIEIEIEIDRLNATHLS